MSLIVKICGLTTTADALAAAAAGANAIGMVFAPSPRRVTPETARGIAAAVPNLTRVGVFTDMPWEVIAALVRSVPLDVVQFPATREPALGLDLGGARMWPTLGMTASGPLHAERIAVWTPHAAAWLLDTAVAGRAGGTGTPFPWHQAQALLPRLGARPMILAGGLTPVNVAAALIASGAQGVDVSSGVERAPGVKDAARVRAFVVAANAAAAPVEAAV